MGDEIGSSLTWPSSLKASRDMTYECIDLLYQSEEPDTAQVTESFILGCSRFDNFVKDDPRGYLHKVDMVSGVDTIQPEARVSHEVMPGLGACTNIIRVNDRLKAAGFENGSLMPVKNFGTGKTFHSDVRGSTSHNNGCINCLASDSSGTQLASACTKNQVALYQVRGESVELLSKTHQLVSFVTGMAYLEPSRGFSYGPNDFAMHPGENVIIYSCANGEIGMLDTRCKLLADIYNEIMITTNPRVNLTSLVHMRSQPGHLVYFGGAYGELFACDLRMKGQYVFDRIDQSEGTIRKMKEIIIHEDGLVDKTFLAYINDKHKLRVLDIETMKPHANWKCSHQPPKGRVKDFVQVGSKLITCGEQCSIGYWRWEADHDQTMS